MTNRHPVYIPSKGRAKKLVTGRLFERDGVDYRIVVEPSQVKAYTEAGYGKRLLVLPEDSKGLVYARNWITAHSRANGDERHWQIDDDCRQTYRITRGHRVPCPANLALAVTEDFVDRYENVAMASLNCNGFVPLGSGGLINHSYIPPFYLNHRCYTWILFLNRAPYDWRPPNNEDADMSLQVLAGGWCTVLMNAYTMATETTMKAKGGQTEAFVAGARLEMVRALERRWPGVVTVGRRFGHPQHFIKFDWKRFDNKLKLKPGVRLEDFQPNEYGMKVVRKERASA